MKRKFILLGICLSLMTLISCKNDDFTTGTSVISDDDIAVNQHIDPAFLPFLNSFFTEMELRGYDFRNDELTMVFVDQLSAPNSSQFCAYGYTNFNGTEGPRVEVLNVQNCWSARTYTEKENLVFHELGHALFSRGHYSSDLPNGMPVSIMCTQSCNNYRVYNKYQTEQRAYYLDELAAQGTPFPSWSQAKTFSETLYTESFDEGVGNWLQTIANEGSNESPYTFFVEADNPITPPFSLGIRSNVNASPSQNAYWYTYFDLSDFESCSNIYFNADIRTTQFMDGYVALVVEQVKDNNGILEHFGRSTNFIDTYTNAMQHVEGFTSKSFCLTGETVGVRVWLYLQNTTNASVLFDNLEINLYE